MFVDSSAFVDPIDEIRNLAIKMKKTVRLVSAMDKKHLKRCIEKKKEFWLIITDINLFNDDLLLIRVRQKSFKSSQNQFSNLGFSFIFN
jgi:exosome complex RNA-binding protein Rrp42 (RNase PH superfamily)